MGEAFYVLTNSAYWELWDHGPRAPRKAGWRRCSVAIEPSSLTNIFYHRRILPLEVPESFATNYASANFHKVGKYFPTDFLLVRLFLQVDMQAN